jgi:hypothetical protein
LPRSAGYGAEAGDGPPAGNGEVAGFHGGHDFHLGVVGLRTATHTGWLTVDHDGATWTPNSRHAVAIPPSKTVVLLGNGAPARLGPREATKSGLASRIGLESPPATTP